MGKSLFSIVLGGILGLLGGYYIGSAGKARAEEAKTAEKPLSCSEMVPLKEKDLTIKDYEQFCDWIGGHIIRQICPVLPPQNDDCESMATEAANGCKYVLQALTKHVEEEKRSYRLEDLCRNVRGERYQKECNDFFSTIERKFIHDCEYYVNFSHFTEENTYEDFCALFSQESMKEQCIRNFKEGINNFCQPLAKGSDTEFDKFCKLLPTTSEREQCLEERADRTCLNDTPVLPVNELLTRGIYGSPRIPGYIRQFHQQLKEEEAARANACSTRVLSTRIASLCENNPATKKEVEKKIESKLLHPADKEKTPEMACAGAYKKRFQSCLKKAGAGDEQKINDQCAGEAKTDYNDCTDIFNDEEQACLEHLPARFTIDEAKNIGNLPKIVSPFEETCEIKGTVADCHDLVLVRDIVGSSQGAQLTLEVVESTFSTIRIKPLYAPTDRRKDLWAFELRAQSEKWLSGRTNSYKIILQARNQHGVSDPVPWEPTVHAYQSNLREYIHSWLSLEYAGPAGGQTSQPEGQLHVRADLYPSSRLRGGHLFLKETVYGQRFGQWFEQLKTRHQEESIAGVGWNFLRAFRQYYLGIGLGGGYSTALQNSLLYAAVKGDNLGHRDFQYQVAYTTTGPSRFRQWQRVEGNLETLFRGEQGLGLVLGGNMVLNQSYGWQAALKYRFLPLRSWITNLDLALGISCQGEKKFDNNFNNNTGNNGYSPAACTGWAKLLGEL